MIDLDPTFDDEESEFTNFSHLLSETDLFQSIENESNKLETTETLLTADEFFETFIESEPQNTEIYKFIKHEIKDLPNLELSPLVSPTQMTFLREDTNINTFDKPNSSNDLNSDYQPTIFKTLWFLGQTSTRLSDFFQYENTVNVVLNALSFAFNKDTTGGYIPSISTPNKIKTACDIFKMTFLEKLSRFKENLDLYFQTIKLIFNYKWPENQSVRISLVSIFTRAEIKLHKELETINTMLFETENLVYNTIYKLFEFEDGELLQWYSEPIIDLIKVIKQYRDTVSKSYSDIELEHVSIKQYFLSIEIKEGNC